MTIIFQGDFPVSGIMCFWGCSKTIEDFLANCLEDCKRENCLPKDAKLIIYSKPHDEGMHRLTLSIESKQANFSLSREDHDALYRRLTEALGIYSLANKEEESPNNPSQQTNWLNILVNLVAMGTIIALALAFPPSLLLTLGLSTIAFLTTAFTAREYLFHFFDNLRRKKNLISMTTTVSLGWFLSLVHTLFHVIAMPLISGFSMIFMNFIMPAILITFINGMDEIRQQISKQTKKMNRVRMKDLFPQMSKVYSCYPLEQEYLNDLKAMMLDPEKKLQLSEKTKLILNKIEFVPIERNILQAGLIIQVKPGECFPVDCLLIGGDAIIDASLLTGEPRRQSKQFLDEIPAGAINLGQPVNVLSKEDAYHSTINRLLFPANRAREKAPQEIPKFTYVYTALILTAMIAALVVPLALGVFTAALLLQNLMGLLFSICFCTITIAYQLPSLISIFHRHRKGIQLHDKRVAEQTNEIHTFVFDKTGTLTTGNSVVESSTLDPESPVWERIYLLEQCDFHLLSETIINHCKKIGKAPDKPLFNQILNYKKDPQNRGLSAVVQGQSLSIGKAAYLKELGITPPEPDQAKLEQGFSPIYVAEGKVCWAIYIKHELRPGVLRVLRILKEGEKEIILLTGDSRDAAIGFNKQNDEPFKEENIHADQTPEDKAAFLKNKDSKDVLFVGDGINDSLGLRIESIISCAIKPGIQASPFSDVCLDGSLNYLLKHTRINRFLQKTILQNQGILAYSTFAFLAFLISFSVVGIAVSPLIPLGIMLSTTLFVLFNSYRVQLDIDEALDQEIAWPKKLLASDLSLALLLGASSLLICAILIATITTGGLALPLIAFSAGALAATGSACTLAAIVLFSLFTLLIGAHALGDKAMNQQADEDIALPSDPAIRPSNPSTTPILQKEHYKPLYHTNPEPDYNTSNQATISI